VCNTKRPRYPTTSTTAITTAITTIVWLNVRAEEASEAAPPGFIEAATPTIAVPITAPNHPG
jgi:hypothetical protein